MINFALWLPNLVNRIANASLNNDDLHGYVTLTNVPPNLARALAKGTVMSCFFFFLSFFLSDNLLLLLH